MKVSRKVQAVDPMLMLKANCEVTIAILTGLPAHVGHEEEWEAIISRIHIDEGFVQDVARTIAKSTVDMAGRIAAGQEPLSVKEEIAKIVALHRKSVAHG